MRITKTEAVSIAQTVANKKYGLKIKDLKDKLKEKATEECRSHIPTNILKISDAKEEAAKYLKYTTSMKFFGNGFNHEVLSINQTPSTTGNYYSTPTIEPSKKNATSLRKMYDKVKDLEKTREDLSKQLEQAFLSLATYKRIKDQFPELAEYFPDDQNMAIVPKYDDLKAKLKAAV